MSTVSKICVFCGSSKGTDREYINSAKKLGTTLAKKNITMIYGGASVGLMGAAALGSKDSGGSVIGVITENLKDMGVSADFCDEMIITKTMHERKSQMAEIADAFLIMPGGIGTLEEFFEVFTWLQLGIMVKPIGILNTNGFYDLLFPFLLNMVDSGFLRQDHLEMLVISDSPEELIEELSVKEVKTLSKWFSVEENKISEEY